MILDKIANAKIYAGLNNKIDKALEYIKNTDLIKIEQGKHEIDGDSFYALINEYDTKEKSECYLEAHRKYIDVQYVVSGSELFGYSPLNSQRPHSEYNEEKDFELFDDEPCFIKFDSGMFAVFFPDDLHMPGINIDKTSRVKKLVLKVRI